MDRIKSWIRNSSSGPRYPIVRCLIKSDNQSDCKELDGYSAINTGVVTDPQIYTLEPELRDRLPK